MSPITSSPKRWILTSSVGIAIGIPAGLALGAPLEVIVGAMIVTPLMLGLSGLFLGGFQWMSLRTSIERPARWIGLTVLGMAIGFTIALVTVEEGGRVITGDPIRMGTVGTIGLIVSVLVLGLLGGGVLGSVQSWAFRSVPGASRDWIAASALGLAGGFVAGVLSSLVVGGVATPVGLAIFLSVTGLVYAAATGRTLARLADRAAA